MQYQPVPPAMGSGMGGGMSMQNEGGEMYMPPQSPQMPQTSQVHLCIPAFIYIFIVIFGLVWQLTTKNFKGMIVSLVMNVIVILILFWLCSKGHMNAAWITLLLFALLPIVLVGIALVVINVYGYKMTKK